MAATQEVLQKFNQWVDTLTHPISMEQAKDYAVYFIANHINAAKVGTRGAVYDLFESVREFADMKKRMYVNQLDATETMKTDTMRNIAYAIVWAVEHDGFDTVKYDPISKWGMDISKMHGIDPA